ncbi:nuclear transport factor 2 family protein [Kitasatospora sp. NPDC056531]|uniref:nuclear transport factor 2 family protein n=1 Tax=Kitasatospora sp. NPDC056531 TaxID=3345856 RepID=UPI0036C53592
MTPAILRSLIARRPSPPAAAPCHILEGNISEHVLAAVERLYTGLGKADIEQVLELFDPEVEIVTPESLPWSTGHYRGLEGAAEYFGNALRYLAETGFVVDEIRVSDEWVAAIGTWNGRFRSSGGEFSVRFVHFWTLRNGRIIKGEGIAETHGIVHAHRMT